MHPGEILREEFLLPLGYRPVRWQKPVAFRERASNACRMKIRA
jgi:plasmid maintenance system antidote protein VapI